MTEIKRVGFIESDTQGNRVYGMDGISVTVASQSGGLGRHGGLYAVDSESSKGDRPTPQQQPEQIGSFRYIELFAGIGGFRTALDKLGGVCVFASEIDKYAMQSYRALYDGAPELHGDITKVNEADVPDHDILVGGFPCQAFSVAGRQKGFEDTRGTLFFEIARIAKHKQPQMMLLENVKGLVSHDNGRTLEVLAETLNEIGYALDFNVLNSKNFGVPQNRERIFLVCSRDAAHEDWNIEGNGVVSRAKRRIQALGVRTFNFQWPAEHSEKPILRDILETVVPEKYYLSNEKTETLIRRLTEDTLRKSEADGYMLADSGLNREIVARENITPPLRAAGGGDKPGIWLNEEAAENERIAGWRVRDDKVFAFRDDEKRSTVQEHVYNREDSQSETVTVGHVPKVIQDIQIYDSYNKRMREDSESVGALTSDCGHKGRSYAIIEEKVDGIAIVGKLSDYQNDRVFTNNGVSPTLSASGGNMGGNAGGCLAEQEVTPIVAGSLEHYGNDQMNRVYSVDGVAPTITVVSGGGREQKIAVVVNDRGDLRENPEEISNALDANYFKGMDNHGQRTHVAEETGEPFIIDTRQHIDKPRIYADHSPTLTGTDYKEPKLVAAEEVRPVLTPDRLEKRQNGRRFKDDGEEAFTLTAQDRHGVAVKYVSRWRIRKLTPLECFRLQAFTDEQHQTIVNAGISDSQRYKQAGNAVTVSVIAALGVPLVGMLKGGPRLVEFNKPRWSQTATESSQIG